MDALPRAGAPGRAHGATMRLVLAIAFGLLLILLFAQEGPLGLTGVVAIAAVVIGVALEVPSRFRIGLVPLGILTVLLGQLSPALNYSDPWTAVMIALALLLSLLREDRRTWELHRPSLIAALFLLAPMPAVVTTVASFESWAAPYKNLVLAVGLFFALRRLVPRPRADVLLWVFPLMGTVGALQILAKTQGLGALLFARLEMRNFYTRLPWGHSNFISAVLELCLCGTLLLAVIERNPAKRLLLLGASILMLQGILSSFSRAGVVSLLAYALVLAIGLGGRRAIGATVAAGAIFAGSLLTPGGQVLVQRFADPFEYGSWAVRIQLWENSLARFLANPWTGIGLNQGRYQGDFQGGDAAHNMLLDVAMEQGVLGAVALVLVFAAAFRLVVRLRPRAGATNARTIRVLALALLVQVIVHAFVEPILLGVPILLGLVYLLAWLCLQDEPART